MDNITNMNAVLYFPSDLVLIDVIWQELRHISCQYIDSLINLLFEDFALDAPAGRPFENLSIA